MTHAAPSSRAATRPGAAPYTSADFGHSPMIVFYEVTRACNLLCQHCRATAQRKAHPHELSPHQSLRLIDALTRFPRPPLLVLTGGDPFKRRDIFDIVRHAVARGLTVAMTPSATPLVTPDAVSSLKQAGLHRLGMSIDAADAATHDAFRGVPGSFDRTLRIMADAAAVDLPTQVNTTITRSNFAQIDAMASLMATLSITMWSVFFLVPVGRALESQRISPIEYEIAFHQLRRHSRSQPYAIKTTEAPHYRRFCATADAAEAAASPGAGPASGRPTHASGLVGTNDGRGVMFIGHTGEIYPSGFMPVEAGRFPIDPPDRVYQQAALFKALRDPTLLKGKCGLCDFRHLCGGSRARAYALTGDPLAPEPDCTYIPPAWAARINSPSPHSPLSRQPPEAQPC